MMHKCITRKCTLLWRDNKMAVCSYCNTRLSVTQSWWIFSRSQSPQNNIISLTHWGRDKSTPFRRRHFQMHFLEWKCINLIDISLKFVPEGRINNIQALVQIMAWCWLGDKPLSELMMVSLLTHICVTQPQWVNDSMVQTARGLGRSIG